MTLLVKQNLLIRPNPALRIAGPDCRQAGNRGRQQRIDQAKALLLPGRGAAPPAEPEETLSIQSPSTEPKPPRWTCPYCGERALVLVEAVAAQARPPPKSDDAAP